MKRVKTAPGNLAKMTHNKKEIKNTSCMLISNVPIIIEEKSKNNYKLINSLKKNVKTIGNLLSDAVVEANNEHYTLEETTLLAVMITYFSNNILKKDKLKELYNFLAKSLVRYLIMLFIHTQVLHDKINYGFINVLPNSLHI
tara:strand:- start:63 stop:488 length:426 start_codon:yes stop_codon:yes gene_type:complete